MRLKWLHHRSSVWWEFRYPTLNVATTANELRTATERPGPPNPQLSSRPASADTDRSGFWVPRLAGKTDLIPNPESSTMARPARDRSLSGSVRAILRSATAHQMLLRVYVQTPGEFARWVEEQNQPAHHLGDVVSLGRGSSGDDSLHELSQRENATDSGASARI